MSFINDHLTRQLDIIPMEALEAKITVIGAGAIGSFTVLSLAKMGFTDITVFDDDDVSVENMNCQFYRFKDIGKKKVIALADLVKEFTKVEIEGKPELYEKGFFPGVVISAVDSMEVRKLIWTNHLLSPHTKAVIDPRMGAESALLYCMCPMIEQDRISYEKTLYLDQDAVQERCTAKATIYTALLLSGLVVKAVKDTLLAENKLRTVHWNIGQNAVEMWSKERD